MIVIVCLDETKGMMFNGRRQSRDRSVTEKIQQICTGKRLWMNAYSYKLYGVLENTEIFTDEDFLGKAGRGDICFVESEGLASFADRIETLIVFWWNRKYPKDFSLDVDLGEWIKIQKTDFSGSSHEIITLEVYKRKAED